MRSYRNKTFDEAFGNVNREWKQMASLAVKLRTQTRLNPIFVEEKEKLFTGIYKRLLTDPIDEVQQEANRDRH